MKTKKKEEPARQFEACMEDKDHMKGLHKERIDCHTNEDEEPVTKNPCHGRLYGTQRRRPHTLKESIGMPIKTAPMKTTLHGLHEDQ